MAYAHAVATAIGVTCDVPKRDINGWDIVFRARDTPDADGTQLAAQLKASVDRLRSVSQGRELSFPLDASDYDYLRKTPTHPPRMLVVVQVPHPSPTRWIDIAPEVLILRASAWYRSLATEPPLPAGQASKTVRIPIYQRFTPAALRANMRSCP